MVTTPRNFSRIGYFLEGGTEGGEREGGRLPLSGIHCDSNLRVVSGSFRYFEFRSADRIASSDDDTAAE